MKFTNEKSVLFVPDGGESLEKVTDLGIGAHPDDLEFMTWRGILAGFIESQRAFMGITLTDGGGSSRTGSYANCSDEEMKKIRLREQKNAACVGNYVALAALGYSSAQVRHREQGVKDDLRNLILASRPDYIYTHNLADRHLTHLATASLVVEVLREVKDIYRPQKLYGCEVWRSLDWLSKEDRLTFDVGGRPSLSMSLMGLYDSQISGGKNYDKATFGRRQANATYNDAYAPDDTQLLELAMDMTPLIDDPELPLKDFLAKQIDNFKEEALKNLCLSATN